MPNRGARTPVLVIHGGAGSRILNIDQYRSYEASLRRILVDVYPKLLRGGSALTAAIRSVELLENDPLYNAGKGSKIQSDGRIRMSASVMDGSKQRFAGCVNVEGVKNPVRLAEALLRHEDRVLSGEGARRFAKKIGLPFSSPLTAHATAAFRARKSGKSGTVGAVALDSKGRLAAATSTGGRGFEAPHRVSDSPTVAGNFATEACAVSATGVGERIVEFSLASRICTMVDCGMSVKTAVGNVLREARACDAGFGLIALDRRGVVRAETATPLLIWASRSGSRTRVFAPPA